MDRRVGFSRNAGAMDSIKRRGHREVWGIADGYLVLELVGVRLELFEFILPMSTNVFSHPPSDGRVPMSFLTLLMMAENHVLSYPPDDGRVPQTADDELSIRVSTKDGQRLEEEEEISLSCETLISCASSKGVPVIIRFAKEKSGVDNPLCSDHSLLLF
ncbi:hypothetical protein M5K25_012904 [Dendrobium thyrsiflorum]|uniref:Uncharacterized protein n=1 Tax=Dendrobium thyrsiflorum TaxID=117978 RepID=A0ABD0UZ06_DENTH